MLCLQAKHDSLWLSFVVSVLHPVQGGGFGLFSTDGDRAVGLTNSTILSYVLLIFVYRLNMILYRDANVG